MQLIAKCHLPILSKGKSHNQRGQWSCISPTTHYCKCVWILNLVQVIVQVET